MDGESRALDHNSEEKRLSRSDAWQVTRYQTGAQPSSGVACVIGQDTGIEIIASLALIVGWKRRKLWQDRHETGRRYGEKGQSCTDSY